MAIDLITEHIRMKLQQPELRRIYRNLELMPSNFQIRGMHTLIRDRTTSKADFVFYADRLLRLVRRRASHVRRACALLPSGSGPVSLHTCLPSQASSGGPANCQQSCQLAHRHLKHLVSCSRAQEPELCRRCSLIAAIPLFVDRRSSWA